MGFYTEAGLIKISQLIVRHLESEGISIRQFAKKCGVNQSHLTKIVWQKIHTPSNELLSKIAPYLGLTLVDLIEIGCEQELEGRVKAIKTAEDVLSNENMPTEEAKILHNALGERLKNIENLEKGID